MCHLVCFITNICTFDYVLFVTLVINYFMWIFYIILEGVHNKYLYIERCYIFPISDLSSYVNFLYILEGVLHNKYLCIRWCSIHPISDYWLIIWHEAFIFLKVCHLVCFITNICTLDDDLIVPLVILCEFFIFFGGFAS